MKSEYGIQMCEDTIEQYLSDADFVSIHIPADESNRNFVNEKFLAQLKKSAYLINTARGAVLDEVALYHALNTKSFAGAALDVYQSEPYEPVSPDADLRKLENIICTPHAAGATAEACQIMAQECLKNIKAAYEKRYDQLDILSH